METLDKLMVITGCFSSFLPLGRMILAACWDKNSITLIVSSKLNTREKKAHLWTDKCNLF